MAMKCGDLREVRACGTRPCPVDCTVSNWGAFTPDKHKHKVRLRTVIQEPSNGGELCPLLTERRSCLEADLDCHLRPPTEAEIEIFGPSDRQLDLSPKVLRVTEALKQLEARQISQAQAQAQALEERQKAVSYTHLTLPTKRIV
eukprot:TRINITY_DN61523_c0_g1_i2.p1 TRINITY_DN61523_c0_g1~~TRINITY_DN61523_c0_g1_i2.p1  ORF type:complete len:144 (-),score=35.36 TRINITY_DN61523_c0_g1_i2:95-526(-)